MRIILKYYKEIKLSYNVNESVIIHRNNLQVNEFIRAVFMQLKRKNV